MHSRGIRSRRSQFIASALLAVAVWLLSGAALAQLPAVRTGDPVPRDVRDLYDAGCRYLAREQDSSGTWKDNQEGPGVTGMAMMVLLAVIIERLVLRPLANQPPMSLFMATIGIAIMLEGIGQLMWGSKAFGLDLGIKDKPFDLGGIGVSQFDLFAAGVAGSLVVVLVIFFNKTATGRALRAVADDHQAAMSIGIPLAKMWRIVWSISGAVALVAGLIWGSRLGVQFGLVVVALKALPVLILGGFTSVAGAIVGGLIIGAAEKLAEVYLGGYLGGGIENWFPYILAMLFLLVRPHGLFGERRIERV